MAPSPRIAAPHDPVPEPRRARRHGLLPLGLRAKRSRGVFRPAGGRATTCSHLGDCLHGEGRGPRERPSIPCKYTLGGGRGPCGGRARAFMQGDPPARAARHARSKAPRPGPRGLRHSTTSRREGSPERARPTLGSIPDIDLTRARGRPAPSVPAHGPEPGPRAGPAAGQVLHAPHPAHPAAGPPPQVAEPGLRSNATRHGPTPRRAPAEAACPRSCRPRCCCRPRTSS